MAQQGNEDRTTYISVEFDGRGNFRPVVPGEEAHQWIKDRIIFRQDKRGKLAVELYQARDDGFDCAEEDAALMDELANKGTR